MAGKTDFSAIILPYLFFFEHGSSESKTLLHLLQSHSDPGGKWSMMACKMGGRVSNFQLYLGLGTQLSYVVFLEYPDFFRREGVRKGFCGFWVAWRWWRASWIFMQLIKLYGIIPPYIQRKYPIFTPLTDFFKSNWLIFLQWYYLSKGNTNFHTLNIIKFSTIIPPIQMKYPIFTP
jgi:hypothetical protein